MKNRKRYLHPECTIVPFGAADLVCASEVDPRNPKLEEDLLGFQNPRGKSAKDRDGGQAQW